jgi:hypothetical protein
MSTESTLIPKGTGWIISCRFCGKIQSVPSVASKAALEREERNFALKHKGCAPKVPDVSFSLD